MHVFDSWIGNYYWTEGLEGIRLLILGESHYGQPGEAKASFTREVVELLAKKKRHSFFTKVAKLTLGLPPGAFLDDATRRYFWDSVAFYNFVQQFPGPKPGYRPTPVMWKSAHEPFLQVLEELKPNALLILGKELKSNLPDLKDHQLPQCAVTHPSRGCQYQRWQPSIKSMLTDAKNGV